MSFLDDVKNPLEDEEFLREIVQTYANSSIEEREDEHFLYNKFITNPESEANEDSNAYKKNFEEYTEKDCICSLLENCLKIDKDEAIEYYGSIFCDEKDNMSKETEESIVRQLENKGVLYRDTSIEIDKWNEMSLGEKIKRIFDGKGRMGFHIKESSINGRTFEFEKDEIKLYINVGKDTYEFSKLFKEKCEEHKLKYYYKVANPNIGEEKRADKMCIFSSFKDIEKYISIVNEIHAEHPKFEYRKPAHIMGKIDDWIGIGVDEENHSYSQSRFLIIDEAFKEVFGESSDKKSIIKKLNSEPGIMQIFKDTIVKKAKAQNILDWNFAFNKTVESVLKPNREKSATTTDRGQMQKNNIDYKRVQHDQITQEQKETPKFEQIILNNEQEELPKFEQIILNDGQDEPENKSIDVRDSKIKAFFSKIKSMIKSTPKVISSIKTSRLKRNTDKEEIIKSNMQAEESERDKYLRSIYVNNGSYHKDKQSIDTGSKKKIINNHLKEQPKKYER